MDGLILLIGLKYSGFRNMYLPEDKKRRDEIDCSRMAPSEKDKMAYYEKYYLETKHLPHGILVDENRRLKDGYISYLLAQKYQLKKEIFDDVEIFQIERDVPCKKIVIGRHVALKDNGIIVKSDRRYRWICDIREPVVPVDVLLVRAGRGKDLMVEDKISYEAGAKSLGGLKKAVKHTKRKIKQTGA